MKALLSCVALLPVTLLARPPIAIPDRWSSYVSGPSHVRFDMPNQPKAEVLKASDGTKIRVFGCLKEDVEFQVVVVDLPEDLQIAMQEAISDSEMSYSRMLLNDAVNSFVESEQGKVSGNDYIRFRKRPARICTTTSPIQRDSRVMAVVGKSHAYLFSVSYFNGSSGKTWAKRFMNSIDFD